MENVDVILVNPAPEVPATEKPRRRKYDPKAYIRLKTRLEANFRDTRQRQRWKLAEILQVKEWREAGVPSVEIAKRLVRSLASVQSVFRKFIYLEELRFPIEKSVMSEKILYEMARKRREQPSGGPLPVG